jgi:hypothetical protein
MTKLHTELRVLSSTTLDFTLKLVHSSAAARGTLDAALSYDAIYNCVQD